ncbi:MAG: RbsD/FucU domain-containing protein [Lachnospiraceae bacterium]|nr:RbsD/FucU domain-containing protein [Lachnospiraceae bacterium]
MLKGIPAVISPELLKVLAEMGHGDMIVIGDAHFASAAFAKEGKLVRADGISAAKMADAILTLMPLDGWAEHSVYALGISDGNGGFQVGNAVTEILEVVRGHDEKAYDTAKTVDRFDFYDMAKQAYAVLATGEADHYGCIILQKGVCGA